MKRKFLKFISFVLTHCLILTLFSGLSMVSVFAATADEIKAAAKAYVAATGNDSTLSGLLSAVQAVASDATLVADDYFIYHAVDGVYDEDPVEADRLSIPGHDGYVSAIFSVGDERISVIETIPHEEENLGVLTKISTSDAVASEIFSISAGGQWRGFVDASKLTDYEKIIIDTNITSIFPCDWTSFVSNAKVLILRNSGSYAGDWTWSSSQGVFRGGEGKGFHQLKAVYMDDCITNGSYFNGARTNYDFCGIETLKYFRFPENGSEFVLSYRDFRSATALENVNTWVLGAGNNNEAMCYCSSLYSIYLGENTSGTSFTGHATNGVIMTYEQQQTATFARAAVLAKQAWDSMSDEELMNSEASLETIKAAYEGKIEGVTAEWTILPSVGQYGSCGTLTLTYNSDAFEFSLGEAKYLNGIGLEYEGAEIDATLTPTFSFDSINYNVTVPYQVTDLVVVPDLADGAVLGEITGNTDLPLGESVISIPVTSKDNEIVTYTITVTREELNIADASQSNITAIKAATKAYVAENGNDSTMAGLLAAVQTVITDATLVAEDYFIYHAVDGVYDEDPDPEDRLSIPGHDGYVSAIFTVGEERISVIETIPHEEENLGVLSKISTSDAIASEIFSISASGQWRGFVDASKLTEYEKIIIDTNITSIFPCAYADFVSNAKVLILRNSGSYAGDWTWSSSQGVFRGFEGQGFQSLKAVYMDDCITNGEYFNGARTNYDFCGMETLKYFRFPENGVVFNTGYGDFNSATSLENVNMQVLGTLDSDYGNSFNSCTSLYSVYLGENAARGLSGGPTNRVVMTYAQQQIATFARAAVLAQAAIDNAIANGTDTADDLIEAVKASYSGKIKNVFVESNSANSNEGFGSQIELSLINGKDCFKYEIYESKALIDLTANINLSPKFNPVISEYTATVPSSTKSLNVNAVAVDGASVESITGNTDLTEGTNLIEISVRNTDGIMVTYTITVNCTSVLSGEAWQAAENYVQSNKNDITPEGLLAAVNTVWDTAQLSEENFFIKHAVTAAKDTDYISGYPLDIKGTDGSVTAVFEYNGGYFTFNSTFGHETESITVKTYAIVGDSNYSDYFDYDESGNVIAIKKAVDKLIIPENYSGTICSFSSDNESLMYADIVKVLIINNKAALKSAAFRAWKNLTAVQFGSNDFVLVDSWNMDKAQFAECSKLKFVKLPDRLNSNWGQHLSVQMFYNCVALENINIPEFSAGDKFIGSWAFGYTKVRDFFLTKNVGTNPNASEHEITYHSIKETGTGNLIYYSEPMSFARATALIGAAASTFNVPTEQGIIASAKNAINGSFDATEFANKLSYIWKEENSTAYKLCGKLTVSNGIYDVEIQISCNRSLAELSIDGYELSQEFNADILNYEISVPIDVGNVGVNFKAADGTSVTVKGENIAKSGKIIVDVSTANDEIVSYEINVKWMYKLDALSLTTLRKALLGVNACTGDINKDNEFDIRDLVNMKKRLAKLVDGYNPYSDDVIKLVSTWDGLTADDFMYAVSYLENGEITDTLFDGIAFTPPKNYLFSYSGTDGDLARLTKRDWSNYINNNLFAYGVNVDALDMAVGELKDTLGLDGYRYDVYLPIIYPVQSLEDWGLLNGKTLNFTSGSEDRIAAMKWFVDEEIRLFNERNYSNLRLRGFYYAHESMKSGDLDIIPPITYYVRQNNMITIWAPYYDANGYQYWADYGVDKATLQINYFGEGAGLPNAGPISNIKNAAERANTYGTGIEMELPGLTVGSVGVLKEYFRGGVGYYKDTFQIFPKNPYIDKFHTWWLSEDIGAIKYFYYSDDSYVRSAYTEMYKFIKNTLSYSDIVF